MQQRWWRWSSLRQQQRWWQRWWGMQWWCRSSSQQWRQRWWSGARGFEIWLMSEWVSDWLRLGLRHLWWLRVRPEGGGCEPIQLWCEMRSERVVAMSILDELLGFERAKVWKTKKGKMERKALLWWVRTVWSVGHSRGRGSEREGRCRGSFRGFFHLFEMETK